MHGGASAVWEIGAREFAASYRGMALDLVAAGMGDTVLGSSMLTAARVAALLGEAADSEVYFARARAHLDANGQRPLRAIADYDEALALRRLRMPESVRSAALLDAASSGFRALGMQGWLARVRRLQE